eukprot:6201599-Pyramimonas_sp.AAC.1
MAREDAVLQSSAQQGRDTDVRATIGRGGGGPWVTIVELDTKYTISDTNVCLDFFAIEGLQRSTTYTANIGSPEYSTTIQFTTPSSNAFEMAYDKVTKVFTTQGPLSAEASQRVRVDVKAPGKNTVVYSSQNPGGFNGSVPTFDLSGVEITQQTYRFEVKDIVTDVVLYDLTFDA